MRRLRNPLVNCAWLITAWGLLATDVYGQVVALTQDSFQGPSDAAALTELFAEQHVPESGAFVCQQASEVSPDERFERLYAWVFPSSLKTQFRITADFIAADDRSNEALQQAPTPVQDHARLVSPAHELVRLAGELKRVDSLRTMILQSPIGTSAEELDRLTLLALLAIEAGEEDRLEESLEQWFKRIQPDPELLHHSAAGLVLLAQAAIDKAHRSTLIREMVRFATHAYRAEYDRPAWLRLLLAYSARLDAMDQSTDIRVGIMPPNPSGSNNDQWHLANLERAFEHGRAYPKPVWQLQDGTYRNLSNYGDMLLFFQSPLLGDFSVEATATGFGYREAHLVVAGHWTGLVFDHEQIMLGDPCGELSRQPIAPPLNNTDKYGYIRTRIDVEDQTAETWMNGRSVHTRTLTQADSPWLAVRSNYRVQGGVDDLRITGEPTIPAQLDLIGSDQLLGWYDYYQPPGSTSDRLGNWMVSMEPGEAGIAVSQIHDPQLKHVPAGSHVEHVLRYLRPILEDGTIAFEFFYVPGRTDAHPVIGRDVYQLTPQGVLRHRLTDGRYDQTELRPDNAAPVIRDENAELPLQPGQWNEVEISLQEGSLTIDLNGQTVCEQPLSGDTPAPQFGLFHFADQTSLLVRNVSWSGQWPIRLPDVAEQQLAGDLEEKLAWTAEQPGQSFHHVFDATSISGGTVLSVEGNPAETVEATADGLIVRQISEAGYRGAAIAPVIDVGGDFDVVVSFDQATMQSELEKIASVRLEINAQSDTQDVAQIQCVSDRSNDHNVQCLRMLTINGKERRSYFGREPAEGSGGRLKFSRRGETIYYLAADNDSNRFRLIAQETFPSTDLQQQGIRLGVQAQGPAGVASARFTELSVRAERLGGVAITDRAELLAQLNEQRDKLPIGFQFDFTKQSASNDDFFFWGGGAAWTQVDGGLELTSVGEDNWVSAGAAIKRGIAGDFDIAFAFQPSQLPTPKKGKQTQVFLQLELTDPDQTQICSILTKNENENVHCQMQVRYRIDGEYSYKTFSNQVLENADQLRLIRRGNELFGIAGARSDDAEVLLGMMELSDHSIAQRGIRMMLHAGGSGRTARIELETIHIHAHETLGPSPATAVIPALQPSGIRRMPTAPQPKSLPGRLFDSLRSIFN
ncbi:DUF1583 domain-containing protein [Neorhodopirellula pilleata]|uniref:Uncharacterized protein n=1 Tax=Neorhodopirellula pilleata TaxID=2714738 RepID=A0A5C6AQD8_9BACT|nr:DUF1583 domain-containing protein [Neorhodopirellula pilleata]TWU01661.1 hypothetical protein Pla100_13960 [Neorhodopirellula pilleata]